MPVESSPYTLLYPICSSLSPEPGEFTAILIEPGHVLCSLPEPLVSLSNALRVLVWDRGIKFETTTEGFMRQPLTVPEVVGTLPDGALNLAIARIMIGASMTFSDTDVTGSAVVPTVIDPQKPRLEEYRVRCTAGPVPGISPTNKLRSFIEPGTLIKSFPKELIDLGNELQVVVACDDLWFQFNMGTFLSKAYPYSRGRIRIGARWITLSRTTLCLGAVIRCIDARDLPNPALD